MYTELGNYNTQQTSQCMASACIRIGCVVVAAPQSFFTDGPFLPKGRPRVSIRDRDSWHQLLQEGDDAQHYAPHAYIAEVSATHHVGSGASYVGIIHVATPAAASQEAVVGMIQGGASMRWCNTHVLDRLTSCVHRQVCKCSASFIIVPASIALLGCRCIAH